MSGNSLQQSREAFLKGHPERSISLNGRQWGLIEAGTTGPRLLLLPGTLGRADIFWQQIKVLESKAQIISVSYPEQWDMRDWAADIETLLNDRNWSDVTVLGSSLGGYFAQYLVGVHPGRFSKLVAANTLCDTAELQTRPPYSLDILAAPIDALREGWVAAVQEGRSSPEIYADLTEMLVAEINGRIPPAELKSRLQALKMAPGLALEPIASESIVTIESDDDPLIPKMMRDRVREELQPAISYIFEEAGHFPYVVRSDDYSALLSEILGLETTGESWGIGSVRRK